MLKKRYCENCGDELEADDDDLCEDCYNESQKPSKSDFDLAYEDDEENGEI